MGELIKLNRASTEGTDIGQVLQDIGQVTFSTTDSQATYRTSLTEITAGIVNITDTWSFATDGTNVQNDVSIPLGAVSGGAITLTRSSSSASGATYSVVLYGKVFDTN